MNDYKVEIQIGESIAQSHVFINGQEIMVAGVKIELDQVNLRPKITLELPAYRNMVLVDLGIKAANPETSELVEALIIEGGKMFKK